MLRVPVCSSKFGVLPDAVSLELAMQMFGIDAEKYGSLDMREQALISERAHNVGSSSPNPATSSVQRALLTPEGNDVSRYGCGKST